MENRELVGWTKDKLSAIRTEVGKVIVGQDEVVESVLVCLVSNGHVLLEGMPGLGKTLLVRTLSDALNFTFSRLQFTPDMMPADVTGTNILATAEDGSRAFEFRKGPVFAQLLLADEINRATPKTQSALLEAMQERQVTAGGARHTLPEPFLVMATQNPIEQEGTYPLPEAQLDRFLFKVTVPYPTKEELAEIVFRTTGTRSDHASQVATSEDIAHARETVRKIEPAKDVLNFALRLIVGTHPEGPGATPVAKKYSRYGSSPRGAQALVTAAKVYALLDGRFSPSVDDIKKAAKPALRHRVLLNFEAEAEGVTPDLFIDQVVSAVEASDKDPVGV